MPRPIHLLLPASLTLSCTAAPAEDAAIAPLPSTGPPDTPAFERSVALIAQDRRQFEQRGLGVLTARIPGVLAAELTRDGLVARSGDDVLALRTAASSGGLQRPASPALGACAPTSELVGDRCAPAAELVHDARLTEWWTSSSSGVRQGWTVTEPLEPGATELELRVVLDQGAVERLDADGRGAALRGSTGGTWRYEDLRAWDAGGTPLESRLHWDRDDLFVRVDVSEARWPVTVDPVLRPSILTEDKLTASDGAAYDYFGLSLAAAGDLDGDGYDDVAVGSIDDDLGSSAGAVYLYYGSASGLDTSTEQKLTASDGGAGDYFGGTRPGAGDFDGDGYGDLVVSAYRGSTGGAVYVYYGSATGLAASSELKLESSDVSRGDYFGMCTAGTGDLDGDGYDDLIVGAYGDDDRGMSSGSAYVYYGSPSGVLASSEDKLTASDGAKTDVFGAVCAGAGDVDGDGYDDVVISATGDDDGATNGGAVYLYLGSATGVVSSSEIELTATDASVGQGFGLSLAGAGDVDDDGYDDVVVGAWFDDDVSADSGAAYVIYGSATGLVQGSEDKLTASDSIAFDYVGTAVAGGADVDGDGYDDVLVGASGSDASATDSGAAYVFFGSASGIQGSGGLELLDGVPGKEDHLGVSVALVGDVDGDGQPDLAVGAREDDDEATNAGAFYVLRSTDSHSVDDAHADMYLGNTVSRAGDVDGDGQDDLVVGAQGDADNGTGAGAVYVYLGTPLGIDTDTEVKLTASDGEADDAFGWSAVGAGDLDADGYDDIAVSATGDDDGGTDAGAIYVYYGSSDGISRSSEDKLTASDGAAGDAFGSSLSAAGDLDADGYDDLIVGAPYDDDAGTDAGAAYVYLGSSDGLDASSEHELTASDVAASDGFGTSVGGGLDLDGDGYDDVVVGAPSHDSNGAAYVYMGSASGIDAASEEQLTASDGASGDAFGGSVAAAGDLDADGFDDLVIGASGDDDGGSASGSAYVRYGSSSGVDTAREDKLTASDAAAGDAFGAPVAAAGDLDADGYDDVIIGAYADADEGAYTGAAYVYFGSASGIDSVAEGKLTASDAAAGDRYGWAVSGAGDLDGDGYADAVVGAPYRDGSAADEGGVYVYAGGCRDLDEDGYCLPDDCDDTDASVYPGADEAVGDEVDSDCDGTEICYADADDDGTTDGVTTVDSSDTDCTDSGEGTATDDTGDCDDSDATIHPGATEGVGDEVDQDCDGTETCYADADDDGYLDASSTVASADTDCSDAGEGLATDDTGDCDDSDAAIHPGATEGVGDEVDSDCDEAEVCYADADDDGYTDGSTTVASADTDCADPGEGLATDPTGECDDTDPSIHPGATELVGDEVDQDCDGTEVCYADADDDDYIDGSSTVSSSDADCQDLGEGAATDPTGECDDADATVNPGATELPGDEVDQDCDGAETCYADADEDGFIDTSSTVSSTDLDCTDAGEGRATTTEDCDDTDATVFPGATEGVGDEVDSDCDGGEVCYADPDDDGYADGTTTVTSADSDCSDSGEAAATDPDGDCGVYDPTIHPGASELPGDEVDSDCDGAELCYADLDGDRYAAADASTVPSDDVDCSGEGEADAGAPLTDCDDTDAAIHPDATEVCDDSDTDEDCDGLSDDADDSVDTDGFETFYADGDADGHGDPDAPLEACDEPEGHTTDATDCDDADPATYPGAAELEDDGVDRDCDGADAEAPVTDGGDSSGDDEGKGSCSAAPVSPAGVLPVLALAVLGVRRRRASDERGPLASAGSTWRGKSP